MENFIEKQKLLNNVGDDIENKIPNIDHTNLNEMQLFVYKIINYFVENNDQLLMIVNGAGGTGKSFLIFAITKLLRKQLKRSAPTAKAAFLIKGETLHSQFRIHFSSKNEVLIHLKKKKLKKIN